MSNLTDLTLLKKGNKYILTEDAVEKIKQADYIALSFETKNGQRVEKNCWLRAWAIGKIPGTDAEVEAGFQMPINISGIENYHADWEFRSMEYTTGVTGATHPMLGLVKAGSAICFRPSIDKDYANILERHGLVKDQLFWQVETKEKTYEGLFSDSICKPDCPHRLIRKKPITSF